MVVHPEAGSRMRGNWPAMGAATLLLLSSIVGCATPPEGPPAPIDPGAWTVGAYLPGTHSHNDYDRRRPLLDALSHGFASIEADIVLRDGELLVAHAEDEATRDRTLAGLYLEPLRALLEARNGTLYPAPAPPLQLLLDIKTEPVSTFEALDALLAGYPTLFTRWEDGVRIDGPVIAIVSGERAQGEIASSEPRRMAIDGRRYEPRNDAATDLIPLVSINWDDTDTGKDRMGTAAGWVSEMQAEGRAIRFWNAGDRPETWAWLRALGVDYIGTDDPAALARFLRGG
ncbi:MAG: hypothetical protein AAF389_20365 [Gemmatimonadota bacterium]